MRTQQPVFYDERTRLWQVFRYEDVLAVLTDYNRFSSQAFGMSGSFLKDTLVAKDPSMVLRVAPTLPRATPTRDVATCLTAVVRNFEPYH
ncbi:MAG: hypothetical protein M3Z24_05325 [Chloroflexota bacterium]|nr:hypothetical protein [Chloroflexota bacterium]